MSNPATRPPPPVGERILQACGSLSIAGAVRPEKSKYLSLAYAEADAIHGDKVAEGLRQVFHQRTRSMCLSSQLKEHVLNRRVHSLYRSDFDALSLQRLSVGFLQRGIAIL
jgi:hypothetical protein